MRAVTKAGFVHELPDLIISEQTFDFRIPEGEQRTVSFSVRASDDSRIRGTLSSCCQRLVPAVREFAGTSCELRFLIDTRGLRAGEHMEGALLLTCGLGEKEVPVSAEILPVSGENFDPQVQTLDDFAQLCRKSMREGFRLFTDPAFPGILNGKNRPYLALYRGMSHNPVTYQHLEEFLVSSGKKEEISITLDKQKKSFFGLETSQKDTLYLYKNTWGYVRLEVETEGDFLEAGRTAVTTDDFIGKVCPLEYVVRRDRIAGGRSEGRIRIRGPHQELVCEIEVSPQAEEDILSEAVRNRRMSWILRDYLALRMHRKDYPSFLEGAAMTAREMMNDDPDDTAAALCMAFLQWSAEENAGAIETLWPWHAGEKKLHGPEEKAACLYLSKMTGLLPEENRDILPALERYLAKKPSSYLLHYLVWREAGEDLSGAGRMAELEACYEQGCASPFLYHDAWKLLTEEEALLRRLSPFMIRVLSFGCRAHLMTEGLLLRTAFLSANLKQWSGPVYRILERGYEEYPSDEVLEAICKLVIRGEPVKPAYFRWYDLALQKDLRITRLYEYYLETFPDGADAELPLQVRMYFTRNPIPGEKKRALLYASIVKHREEDMTGYLNYARQIRSFAVEGIRRGKIDENYAVIYEQFLSRPETKETAELLSRVLFTHRFTCSDRRIRRVVVCHQAMREEEYYPVTDGTAWPCLYTEDACVLLEDDRHRRFATTIPYTLTPLLGDRHLARLCMDLGSEHPGLMLSVCREKAYQMELSAHNLGDYRKAAACGAFTDEYRMTLRRKLTEFILDHPDEPVCADCISADDVDAWAAADRNGTAEILIREERYEEACHVLGAYGCEGMDPTLLMRLVSRLILRREFAGDRMLTALTWQVFDSDRYDEVMLVYLRDHFDGSLFDLERLWEKVRGFQLESVRLEEKILQRAIDVHSFPVEETDILRSCIRQRGKQSVICRFLEYLCAWYFLGGRSTDAEIFDWTERELLLGAELDEVCSLALLKHWSETDDPVTGAREDLCRRLLEQENRLGRRFAFYSGLPSRLTQAWQIEDKLFVQTQMNPSSRVILHYRRTEAGMEPQDWVSEPMRNVYEGIFVKEFLLFYGETIVWYMSVHENGEFRRTEEENYTMTDAGTEGTTKYRLLNRMLEASERKDDLCLRKTAEQYLLQSRCTAELMEML